MRNRPTCENTLYVEQLSYGMEKSEDRNYFYFGSKLKIFISCRCTKTGEVFRRIDITAEGKSTQAEDSLRDVIQNFIDGRSDRYDNLYDKGYESDWDNTVHFVKILVQEPYKTVFEQIFDKDSWQILRESELIEEERSR